MTDSRRPACPEVRIDPQALSCFFLVKGTCCHAAFNGACPLQRHPDGADEAPHGRPPLELLPLGTGTS